MSKEAMKLALEALELVNLEFVCANGSHHAKKDRHEWDEDCPITDRWRKAITALREALAEQPAPVAKPQQQEPVATVTSESGNPNVSMSWWHEPALPVGTKLYTSPPAQRKPLTDEEKDAARWRFLVDNSFDKEGITQFHVWEHSWEPHSQTGEPTEWKQRVGGPALDRFIDLAIEAAHGIKENT